MRALILLSLLFFAAAVPAQTYRCVSADGKTRFSTVPCPQGSTGGPMQLRENVLDYSENRANRDDTEAEQADLDRRGLAAMPMPARAPSTGGGYECDQAQRSAGISPNPASRFRAQVMCSGAVIPNGCRSAIDNWERSLSSRNSTTDQARAMSACR